MLVLTPLIQMYTLHYCVVEYKEIQHYNGNPP